MIYTKSVSTMKWGADAKEKTLISRDSEMDEASRFQHVEREFWQKLWNPWYYLPICLQNAKVKKLNSNNYPKPCLRSKKCLDFLSLYPEVFMNLAQWNCKQPHVLGYNELPTCRQLHKEHFCALLHQEPRLWN